MTIGALLIGTGIVTIAPMAPPAMRSHMHAVQLTGVTADSPLGNGVAFVIGGSGTPVPSQAYVDAANTLYLAPRGFTGDAQAFFTPEGLQPTTGVKTLPFDTSEAQGQQILDESILRQITGGGVSAENPIVVWGWSQSSVISSLLMPELKAQGVPVDDVHFVLVGNESSPNGGALESFNIPVDGQHITVPSLGITFSGAMPSDLYPTDNYTIEYDGFADFPKYSTNLLSDLNAIFGIVFAHSQYQNLTADQLTTQADGGQAIQLPTSVADTMANYYMIPNAELPLLQPLQAIPVIGQPLYDLLEPDTRILVNLGYGSITEGWNQGDADVPTTIAGGLPPNISATDLATALGNGLQKGITDAVAQLQDPDNYQVTPDSTDPTAAAPSFLDLVNDFSGSLSKLYATLLPDADTANALLVTLPATLGTYITEQAADGNLMGGISEAVAAATALVPFAFFYGVAAPLAGALDLPL
ncbi:PE-PPE domain-containing protein [Mycobacterium sp. M1]|uniref:PE-PPE domain-containing protein n=1 Tax=Mycolicibacter acidiphilus TaxID=2835306 RepID=A0ABS5RQP0_9MYCO|nr:PE-PPE domain-containing protein [Mycolicibacter acidiphilus]MBS9535279.1 PE-PPE domain-containing protein [Mycolicibacter acidiphilus]